mmetsp:Transcript_112972/g.326380  ORF Transcript_112972/g.326380 Transcript_112972/m.326380 type:complete len:333 (-) Transcript_112972:708-1706(-)
MVAPRTGCTGPMPRGPPSIATRHLDDRLFKLPWLLVDRRCKSGAAGSCILVAALVSPNGCSAGASSPSTSASRGCADDFDKPRLPLAAFSGCVGFDTSALTNLLSQAPTEICGEPAAPAWSMERSSSNLEWECESRAPKANGTRPSQIAKNSRRVIRRPWLAGRPSTVWPPHSNVTPGFGWRVSQMGGCQPTGKVQLSVNLSASPVPVPGLSEKRLPFFFAGGGGALWGVRCEELTLGCSFKPWSMANSIGSRMYSGKRSTSGSSIRMTFPSQSKAHGPNLMSSNNSLYALMRSSSSATSRSFCSISSRSFCARRCANSLRMRSSSKLKFSP